MFWKQFDLQAETAVELLPIISALRKLHRTQQFDELQQALVDMPMSECSITAIASVLRTTYQSSMHMPRYLELVELGKTEIYSRGEDGSQILRGLFVPYHNPFAHLFPQIFN